MLPICPAFDQMQPKPLSIILRKVRCIPLGATRHHRTPKVLLFTPKFICSTNWSLIPCALHLLCCQIFLRRAHAQWVSWETLHPTPLQVVVVPKNICWFPWLLFPISESRHHSTNVFSSTVVVKKNSPQGFLQSVPKCWMLFTRDGFDTLTLVFIFHVHWILSSFEMVG
jgi:hypothetical protein